MSDTVLEKLTTSIPTRVVGPIKLVGKEVNDDIMVPLATYESPLWPSTNRGARVSVACDGINVTVVKECMTRSILVEANSANEAVEFISSLKIKNDELQKVVSSTSRYAVLDEWNFQIVGNMIYIRLSFTTGDASGHNMATKAADAVLSWILKTYTKLKYVSISGNYCTDKKATAVNGILGRGKYVIAEIVIPKEICNSILKTEPEKIVELNIKKNLIGTSLAGGVRSANAHFANMLLAIYLSTGQDAANIIEGSQGFVHAELRGDDLYFSVTLPNIIVGTVGNGKDLPFIKKNLEMLGCTENIEPGKNGRKLASIVAATVLCGELSLLAAQTNPGELIRSHVNYERRKKTI